MNDYIGKICPFCKTPFLAEDEVVVCSACDMPHHKECWVENQGCTTFGCLGAIKTADSAPTAVTAQLDFDAASSSAASDVAYCAHCGAPVIGDYAFCPKCGSPLSSAAAPAASSQSAALTYTPAAASSGYSSSASGSISSFYDLIDLVQRFVFSVFDGDYSTVDVDAQLAPLVGTKTEYYIPRFHMLKTQGKPSWNWAAFIFSHYWFFYRKMYVHGAVLFGILFLLSFHVSVYSSLLSLGCCVACGIYGNSVYMTHLTGKCAQLKTMTEPSRSAFIAQNGGVNATVAVVAGAVYMVLALIINAL